MKLKVAHLPSKVLEVCHKLVDLTQLWRHTSIIIIDALKTVEEVIAKKLTEALQFLEQLEGI
jgi:hypothetical protein